VHALHKKNITHRDLKLENILLNNDFVPLVGDFGFARNTQGDNGVGSLPTKLVGTDGYRAPELLQN